MNTQSLQLINHFGIGKSGSPPALRTKVELILLKLYSQACPPGGNHPALRTAEQNNPRRHKPDPAPPARHHEPHLPGARPRRHSAHLGVPPPGGRRAPPGLGRLQHRGHVPGLGARPRRAARPPGGHEPRAHGLQLRLRHRRCRAHVRHARPGRRPRPPHGPGHD